MSSRRLNRQRAQKRRQRRVQRQNGGGRPRQPTSLFNSAITVSIPRSKGLIFPTELDCTMPWSTTANLTTANPGIGQWILRGNSPYDPDYSGAGYTATGWPQLHALYNRMLVRSSRITVAFKSNTGAHQAICIVFPTIDTTSRVASMPDALRARPRAVSVVVSGGADEARKKITTSAATKSVVDTSNDRDLVLVGAANPTLTWFWHVYTAYMGGYTAAANFDLEIIIEYNCHWYDPIDPTYA